MIGKTFVFIGQPVDIWGLDFFLSVNAQFAVTEVIGKDVDDVGLLKDIDFGSYHSKEKPGKTMVVEVKSEM